MKQRINILTLGVADLAKSRSFYRSLGWKESSTSNENICFFQAGTLVFGLYPQDKLAHEFSEGTYQKGHATFTMAYNTNNILEVDAVFSELRELGITILKEPEEVFWGGYSGYFSDPDGYLWEVAFNPHLALTADGFLELP